MDWPERTAQLRDHEHGSQHQHNGELTQQPVQVIICQILGKVDGWPTRYVRERSTSLPKRYQREGWVLYDIPGQLADAGPTSTKPPGQGGTQHCVREPHHGNVTEL